MPDVDMLGVEMLGVDMLGPDMLGVDIEAGLFKMVGSFSRLPLRVPKLKSRPQL